MTDSRGFQGICGLGAESPWGTAVVATQLFPFLSEGITDAFEQIPNDANLGLAALRPPSQGVERATGTLAGIWRYVDSDLLLQHFFGDLTAGTYSMQDTIDDTGLTVAIEKGVSVWEFAGYKVGQLVIAGQAGGYMQVQTTGQASTLDLSSIINTSGVLSGLSISGNNILFQEIDFRIADQADALGAGDALNISSLTVTMSRNQTEAVVNQQTILEPMENGHRDVTLQFTLPRYQSNSLITLHRAQTPVQARLYWTDGSKSKEILLPNGLITSVSPNIGGPGLVPVQVSVTWYGNQGDNALNSPYDMSAITAELELNET